MSSVLSLFLACFEDGSAHGGAFVKLEGSPNHLMALPSNDIQALNLLVLAAVCQFRASASSR